MPNGSWRAIVQFLIVMLFGLHDHSSSRGAQTGVQIPISVDGDVVVVPVKIHGNSKVFRFVVDTGAEITIIDTPTVEILKLSPGRDVDLESDQGKARKQKFVQHHIPLVPLLRRFSGMKGSKCLGTRRQPLTGYTVR